MTLQKFSSKIQIISPATFENPFVVIYKPQNIPSAPLKDSDKNCALYQTAQFFPDVLKVNGRKSIEKGLVHRIDTATDGLLLLATEQKSYDYFLEQENQGNFIKSYTAICQYIKNLTKLKNGFPQNLYSQKIENMQSGDNLFLEVKSYFRAFGKGRKEVRPVIKFDKMAALKKSSLVEYSTKIKISKTAHNYICYCQLEKGFRHQVRCHLAWIGLPICGDKVYNPTVQENCEFMFSATGLDFFHPITQKKLQFSI